MASSNSGRAHDVSGAGRADPPDLDVVAIVSACNSHGVRYVVIGAFAAIAQQAPIVPTRDIDFTPDGAVDNLRRLSAALKDLDARIRRGAGAGLPFDDDARSLARAAVWKLTCEHGEFDAHSIGYDGESAWEASICYIRRC